MIGEGISEPPILRCYLNFKPVWAVGTSGQIASFPVLPGIEALTVLGENDPNGANERAALECMERWEGAGTRVLLAAPRQPEEDFNDAWIVAQDRGVRS